MFEEFTARKDYDRAVHFTIYTMDGTPLSEGLIRSIEDVLFAALKDTENIGWRIDRG